MLPPIYLICQNIRSRHNVGSIFRSADAFAMTKIYLCGYTPCPPHPDISKTALGAEKTVPWERHLHTWRVVENLKKQGIPIIALELAQYSSPLHLLVRDHELREVMQNKGMAIVVGNEVRGITHEILRRANHVVHVPMYGRKESLNVSVAAGIALYTLRTIC